MFAGEKQIFFSENDYCAMLRAYTVLHAAMFTLHWEAFADWLIQEEKDMDYIYVLASNQLEALLKNAAAGASSLCNDATSHLHKVQLHMT